MARPPIPWVGGKEKLIPFILQVFPPKLSQYVEPFGGSGAVLLALPPKKGRLDIYNDLNSDLSNLFVCIRDKCLALLRELKLLPIHSRAEFDFLKDFTAHKELYFKNIAEETAVINDRTCFTAEQAAELLPLLQGRAELFDVRRAAAYFTCSRRSFNGTTNTFGVKACNIVSFLRLVSEASERLKDVVIENRNGIQIIKERDRQDGLIYCDPPYYEAERCYAVRFSRRSHIRLWQVLSDCLGYVVLSYNDSPFIRHLYKDFYILAFRRENPMSKKKDSRYGELIITNYDPRPYLEQLNLFTPTLEAKHELVLVNIPTIELRQKNIQAAQTSQVKKKRYVIRKKHNQSNQKRRRST